MTKTNEAISQKRSPLGGRPSLLATDKRSEKVEVRLTVFEKTLFREKAIISGQSVSEWLRNLGHGHVPKMGTSTVDMALISELSRIGNNVNQLARATHRGRDTSAYWQDVGRELERILNKAASKI